ncbi:uncharacterized protein TNCV_4198321 [Trichonephila clavipes]|nr:uncharacterized protein TNCV_4198321 [Trichonephila clavipes]
MQDENVTIPGPFVIEKVLQFAKASGYDQFLDSNGRLEKFKKRHGKIHLKRFLAHCRINVYFNPSTWTVFNGTKPTTHDATDTTPAAGTQSRPVDYHYPNKISGFSQSETKGRSIPSVPISVFMTLGSEVQEQMFRSGEGCASLGVVHVTWPWFKITWSVTKSPRVAEQCDVDIHSLTQNDRIWCVDAPSTSAIVEHRQYPKSVMAWSGICASGKTPLVFVEEGVNINQKMHRRDIIEAVVPPWDQRYFGNSN